MYRKFFGLSKLPFKSSPDIDIFYKSGSRQDILEALVYTVSRGDGITKVTGEVGSGKTMLLRLLADSLPKKCKILYINTPNLSPKDMLMHICNELGLKLDGLTFKYALLDMINKELVRLYSEGQQVVMLIDEAQAMTFDTLEEIRLLSNLETSDGKLLQIVLFGQSELDIALANNKIRQLQSRISYSIFIPALSPEEVCAYLNYRVRRASYEGLDIFDLNVSKEIHKLSKGIPRAINTIADKLLMSSYSFGDVKVTKKHLLMLPGEVGSKKRRYRRFIKTSYILLLTLAVLAGIYLVISPLFFNSFLSINTEGSENVSKEGYTQASSKEFNLDRQKIKVLEQNIATEEIEKPSVGVSNERLELKTINNGSLVKTGVEFSEKLSDVKVFRVKGSLLSKELISLHLNTVEWLVNMPEQMYLIQLASPHVSTLGEAVGFYKEQGVSMDSIHLLIDLGRVDQKNRFRVFYLASASYSTLERIISELPVEVLKSKPYIVTVGGVLRNLKNTQYYLKQHGIINVY